MERIRYLKDDIRARGPQARRAGCCNAGVAARDIDLATIAQAGGWKSTRLPL